MPGWIINVAALLFSILGGTVYFQHQHNIDLNRELTAAHQALSVVDAQMKADRANQKKVADLDQHYTEQLTNARSEINRLRHNVLTGHSQLRVSAKCVSDNSTSRSLGDAASPRLTNTAQSNYWILRERIELSEKQIDYLQDYIRQINK